MVTEVARRLINVDEFYKMAEVGILKPSDRVELIHGDILDMSPIGSKHASIVDRLARVLNILFEKETVVGIQRPVRLDDRNEPEPDVAILKYRSDYYAAAHPGSKDTLAIIEVSDSTIKYDTHIKLPLYASFKIPAYWVVDVDSNRIIVNSEPDGTKYLKKDTYKAGDKIPLLTKEVIVSDILPPELRK